MATNYNPRIVTDGLVLALDAGNRKSYSHNYHPKPVDGYGWVTSASAATLSRDTIQSPVGSTPLKMVISGSDPYTRSYNSSSWNIASAAQGQTWTFSVWAKASTSTSGELYLFEANSSGNYINLSNSGINITAEWQRFSITRTFTDATTNYIQVRVDGPNSGGTGQTIWWDGFQVERSSSMSTFTSVYTGETSYNLINATNNGTLTNGVSYNDSNNGSFVFDGIDDYVSISNLGLSTNTIEGWINSFDGTQGGTGGDTIVSAIGYYSRVGSDKYTYIGFLGNNTLTFRIDDGVTSHRLVYDFTYTSNQWYHVALSYNSSNGSTVAYINGNSVGSITATTGIVFNSVPFDIADSENGNHFDGSVAMVKVYNRALTASEIQQNFNATRSRFGI